MVQKIQIIFIPCNSSFYIKKCFSHPILPIQALRYSVFTSVDIITMHYNILHIANSSRSMSSVGNWSWAC